MSLTLFSPAKLNLFLRILGKRPDGYHEIASLFQAIGMGDHLTFALASEDRLTCSDTSIPCDASNLVSKAVTLFRKKTGLKFGIEIHIQKNIPTQAGLGGGSSNAATTLWALNALHQQRVTELELQHWSAEIGSDVPFFFCSGTAYCTGRGEILREMNPIPGLFSFSIHKPAQGLATPAIYQALQLGECSKEDPEELLSSFYAGEPAFINDLEKPAFRLCPLLPNLKQQLIEEHKQPVFMTGSGTALIRVGEGEISPIHRQPNKGSWWPCKTL